jgi:hypothetical protein
VLSDTLEELTPRPLPLSSSGRLDFMGKIDRIEAAGRIKEKIDAPVRFLAVYLRFAG